MIKIAGNQARAFAEQVMDEAEAHGFVQADMVGLDAETRVGISGSMDDILATLLEAQKKGAATAMIFLEVTNSLIDVVVFVESVPEGQEEVVPLGDPGPVLTEGSG